MSKKTVNYTAADIEQLESGYNPEATQVERQAQVKQLAADMGRKPASIIAKLVNLKVYVKNTQTPKTGSERVSKDERVSEIAEQLGVLPELMDSLAKANVSVIKLFADVISERDTANHNLEQVLDSVESAFSESE